MSGASVALLEVAEPQRVVAEQMVEVVDQADVRPVVTDADQFDAVAPVGRGRRGELRLEQAQRFRCCVSGRSAS